MRRFSLSNAQYLFEVLGLNGASGVRKAQQLEHLLPWLIEEIKNFHDRPLVEFACGKGYVSFAFRYVELQMGLSGTPIIGLDCSEDAIAQCKAIRDRLGWTDMNFQLVNRGQVPLDLPSPHAVVSLHACDSATDQAIATGIFSKANLLLHVPCCHRTVQRKLRVEGHRHTLGYLCRSYPMLGDAFSQFLTEGARCLQIQTFGYETMLREFVSPRVTPKNRLIIGRLGNRPGKRAACELALIAENYGIPLLITQMLNNAKAENILFSKVNISANLEANL